MANIPPNAAAAIPSVPITIPSTMTSISLYPSRKIPSLC